MGRTLVLHPPFGRLGCGSLQSRGQGLELQPQLFEQASLVQQLIAQLGIGLLQEGDLAFDGIEAVHDHSSIEAGDFRARLQTAAPAVAGVRSSVKLRWPITSAIWRCMFCTPISLRPMMQGRSMPESNAFCTIWPIQ
jgi:hypothetical protein